MNENVLGNSWTHVTTNYNMYMYPPSRVPPVRNSRRSTGEYSTDGTRLIVRVRLTSTYILVRTSPPPMQRYARHRLVISSFHIAHSVSVARLPLTSSLYINITTLSKTLSDPAVQRPSAPSLL